MYSANLSVILNGLKIYFWINIIEQLLNLEVEALSCLVNLVVIVDIVLHLQTVVICVRKVHHLGVLHIVLDL
jgi:hypothetical protein